MKRVHVFVIAICKAALLMTVLSSCPAPWSGGEGTITIGFGPSGRIPVTIEQMNVMAHEIILTGPSGETIVYRFTGPGPIAITVTPGTWTIRTRSVGLRGEYGAAFPEQMLRALGFGDGPIEVVAGEYSIARVTVISAVEVATSEQLSVAIDLARTDGREKIIVVTNDIEVADTLSIAEGRNITLTSNTDVTIRRATGFTGPIFHEDGGTITIGDRINMPTEPGHECDRDGHDWGEWVVTIPPTITDYGEETRICARCGDTETRPIPPLDAVDVSITFVANATGVSGLPGPLQGTSGTTIAIPTVQLARDNWFFAGWNTDPDARGSPYWPGDAIEIGDADITLYAIWSEFGFKLSGMDGNIVVTGLVEGRTETDIVIPPVINGMQVIEIGRLAFAGEHWVHEDGELVFIARPQLTSVIIPYGVIYIGTDAFHGNRLVNVTIPNSVTTIGWGAFMHNQLVSVIIPDSVTIIGFQAFAANQLASVTIPDSVTSIEGSAFLWNQLTSVIIPNGVTIIELQTFAGNQLTSVTIPDGVVSIGDRAFSGNQLTSVTIPDSVTIIELAAFLDNQLTHVTIPNSVTYIGEVAFAGNPLTSITIPSNVDIFGLGEWERHAMGVHGYEFLRDYIANGRQGGTYTWASAQMRWVFDHGEAAFTISFVGFQTMPQNATIHVPDIGILSASTTFSVAAPAGYVFDNIRWLFDRQTRSTDASFDFTREMHGGRLGTHFVTLEVEIAGRWFSRIVNVTVVP